MSYQSLKRHRVDLTKYCIKIAETNNRKVPLSYFDSKSITLLMYDTFNQTDKITLTGQESAHGTVITLFQEKPYSVKICKPLKNELEIKWVQNFDKLLFQKITPWKHDMSENLLLYAGLSLQVVYC